eukprot:scaffold19001_cov117-Isochrysis_galbana.AAC.1
MHPGFARQASQPGQHEQLNPGTAVTFPRQNRGKPQLGRWAFYWEGVFGAAQNVGRFWCRHPARLLWASGGHPRGQSRLIWVRQGRSLPSTAFSSSAVVSFFMACLMARMKG